MWPVSTLPGVPVQCRTTLSTRMLWLRDDRSFSSVAAVVLHTRLYMHRNNITHRTHCCAWILLKGIKSKNNSHRFFEASAMLARKSFGSTIFFSVRLTTVSFLPSERITRSWFSVLSRSFTCRTFYAVISCNIIHYVFAISDVNYCCSSCLPSPGRFPNMSSTWNSRADCVSFLACGEQRET